MRAIVVFFDADHAEFPALIWDARDDLDAERQGRTFARRQLDQKSWKPVGELRVSHVEWACHSQRPVRSLPEESPTVLPRR
jgi:hypothetical protein